MGTEIVWRYSVAIGLAVIYMPVYQIIRILKGSSQRNFPPKHIKGPPFEDAAI